MTTTTQLLNDEIRLNLLASALEGGSNYWYTLHDDALIQINELCPSDGKTPLVERLFKAIQKGARIPVGDIENDLAAPLGYISAESLEKADDIMMREYTDHFADALSESDDATTGDIYFQLAVMEKVIFG